MCSFSIILNSLHSLSLLFPFHYHFHLADTFTNLLVLLCDLLCDLRVSLFGLTILTWKTVIYSINCKNILKWSLAASDPFPMFTQSVNFYTIYCSKLKSTYTFLSTLARLRQSLSWFLSSHKKTLFLRDFILSHQKTKGFSKYMYNGF